MKACVYADLEKVEVVDIDLPSAGPDEVLIKVARAGICGTDLHIFMGHMDQRVTKPLVMGHEMCGEIVEAPDGADYQVGERVAYWSVVHSRWRGPAVVLGRDALPARAL